MKPDAEIDDLHSFLDVLPSQIRENLLQSNSLNSLIEVVLDLGRKPQVRFVDRDEEMDLDIISFSDLDLLTEKIGRFGNDNRAGVEKTLHRFSAIRARDTTLENFEISTTKFYLYKSIFLYRPSAIPCLTSS